MAAGISLGILALAGAGIAFFWRPMRSWGRQVQVERARESFKLQRERLETVFFQAASRSGKPRDLRWTECIFEPHLELARQKGTNQLVGLVPVAIRFEAVEGGSMEGVEAVNNVRMATAVFFFHKGQWQTVGKAVFNLGPVEVIEHFHNQYERIVLL